MRLKKSTVSPAVSQPRGGPSNPKSSHHKKVARSIQSNATVQVLPGLAGDVPSPYLIMRTKSQQNVKANGGLNAPPVVEQPALSISTRGASSPTKTQEVCLGAVHCKRPIPRSRSAAPLLPVVVRHFWEAGPLRSIVAAGDTIRVEGGSVAPSAAPRRGSKVCTDSPVEERSSTSRPRCA